MKPPSLCIRQLRKYVNADSEIIDVGTGSGILGIAALKRAQRVYFGTDLDENAIVAVGENLESNNIPADRFQWFRATSSSMIRLFRTRWLRVL